MVNAFRRRGLAGGLARSRDFPFTPAWQLGRRLRPLAVVGALSAGLAVIVAIAVALLTTPRSQMLSAISAAANKFTAAAPSEPIPFADRFAADVGDVPPTVRVSTALSNDPLATPLAELAVRLAQSRDLLEGRAEPPISTESIAVAPEEQPHARSQTTGTRP
jgi:hypothetical protein